MSITKEQMEKYTKNQKQFVEDMENEGYEVEHYHGRFYFQGPAVRVDDLHELTGLTSARLAHDNMGMGYIIFAKK